MSKLDGIPDITVIVDHESYVMKIHKIHRRIVELNIQGITIKKRMTKSQLSSKTSSI